MTLRRAVTQLLHARQPVTVLAMLTLAGTGLLSGLVLGYLLMGTVHTVRLNIADNTPMVPLAIPCQHCALALKLVPARSSAPTLPRPLQVLEFGSGPRRPRAQAIRATEDAADVFAKHEHVAVHDAAATTDIPKERPFSAHGDAKPFPGPAAWPTVGSTVHTLCTSNGSPYVNFQNRIMYATYQLAQRQPGGELLAAFTRILHRTVEDELMQVRAALAAVLCLRHLGAGAWPPPPPRAGLRANQ